MPSPTRWSSGWRRRWATRRSIRTATRSPTADGSIHELVCTPLADVPVGETVEIRRVDEREPERLRYLASLGLVPGAVVTVCDHAAVRRPGHGRGRGRPAT